MPSRTSIALGLPLALGLSLALAACNQSSGVPAGEEAGTPDSSAEILEPTAAGPVSAVPSDTFVNVTIGDPQSLDPAWTYETTGAMIESNIYDSLLAFDREKPDAFVPSLAEEWSLSGDKLTYTFTIRDGVSFHAGGTLTPSDIAYSLQRALLQDRTDGPMTLLLTPILGAGTIEGYALAKAGISTDVPADAEKPTLATVPAEVQKQVCEDVKAAIQADDAAGTLTITLKQPTAWFTQLLSQPWSAALDKEWMIEQKDWDDSCDTWAQWHNPKAEESVLFDKANGTGPYMLGEWKKDLEITLDANESYWRTDPIWEGGPSGPPRLKHIVLQKVEEWGTRFAKLSAGEADTIVVPRGNIDQLEDMIHTTYEGGDENAPAVPGNPEGTLELFMGYPTQQAEAAMFNFNINPESVFIGSGALDGEGIPPDFFSDIHVRQGFRACFNWDAFIEDALKGEGVQTRGPIIQGLQGYSDDSPIFGYDPEKCKAELDQAWGGKLPEAGFKMAIAYNKGNDTRKTAANILADELKLVDAKYQIDVQELEWATFLEERTNQSFPISVSGWLADYYDASNWVEPFMASNGAYARAQSFPAETQAAYDAKIQAALTETDDGERDTLYAELQQAAIDDAISIWLAQATGRFYVSQQTNGWYHNPLSPGLWYYALGKE
jgi:peptide/nickel transport system substrate-binding protein